MIPSIEEILAGLLAGNYTLAQSTAWIYRHQEMAAEAGDEKAVRLQLAAMAMQGLLSNKGVCYPKDAFDMADAMLVAA